MYFSSLPDQTKESHGKWVSSLPISSYGHHLILKPLHPANDDDDDEEDVEDDEDDEDDHHLIPKPCQRKSKNIFVA